MIILGCFLIMALVVIGTAVSTAVIYFAWNLVIVYLFGVPVITWWMALLLGALISIIGGAFRHTSSKE